MRHGVLKMLSSHNGAIFSASCRPISSFAILRKGRGFGGWVLDRQYDFYVGSGSRCAQVWARYSLGDIPVCFRNTEEK